MSKPLTTVLVVDDHDLDMPVMRGEAFLEKPFSQIGLLEAVAQLMFDRAKKSAG